jgi:hypothetical protein
MREGVTRKVTSAAKKQLAPNAMNTMIANQEQSFCGE